MLIESTSAVTVTPAANSTSAATGNTESDPRYPVTVSCAAPAGSIWPIWSSGSAADDARLSAAIALLIRKYSGHGELSLNGGQVGLEIFPESTLLGLIAIVTPHRGQDLAGPGLLIRPGRKQLQVSYDPERYHPAMIERIPAHLDRIRQILVNRPHLLVNAVDPLDPAERAELLRAGNATERPYARQATIPELFAVQAAAGPDRPAIVHRGRTWTYRQVDARAEELAQALRRSEIAVDEPVGLLVERTPDWPIGALAILRSGGAYLPLDPHYPAARLTLLLEDSQARVLLTTAALATDVLPGTGFDGTVILLDQPTPDPKTAGPQPVPVENGPDDVACIIYTSGTTGRPKGVQVTHRNVIRLVNNPDYVELSAETHILQANSVVFDSSTFELWGSLLNGGALVLPEPDALLDAGVLRRTIAEHGITTMMLTPALFNQLAEQDPSAFAALRYQFVGGDVLSPQRINAVRAACPALTLINGYGPTENTTISACHHIEHPHEDRIPIGRPISNSTAYVCDLDGRPQPVGVPGELWVGGDGLARGYLNRPELTETAFVRSTLDPGGRLYRTGDLVRRLPDGTLDFLGRSDDQVKIRGYRIELGEIEHRLRRHPEVHDAVVVVRRRPGTDEKYLCGYVVADVEPRAVREYLGLHLPEHLIPAFVVPLAEMPLSPAGKLDRAALPDPGRMDDAQEYRAARDELERQLVRAWEEVLGVQPIGVVDDIFDLGITSLAAAAITARIQKDLGRPVSPSILLKDRTIDRVAERLRAQPTPERPVIDPAPVLEWYPLAPQQYPIYVEQTKDASTTQYNQPMVVRLPAGFDRARLAEALLSLFDRHESLRTGFDYVDGAVRQQVRPRVAVQVSTGHGPLDLASFVRPFDLSRPPLLRAHLQRTPDQDGTTWLLLDLHHIITDGFSIATLIEELDALYAGRPLPEPPARRHLDYAYWSGQEPAVARANQARTFWQGLFADFAPTDRPELPTDRPRSGGLGISGGTVEFEIDPDRTRALRRLAQDQGVTDFHLLMAVYQVFLARVTGSDDVTIGTPVDARGRLGMEGVTGMFVNTLCLRGRPRLDQDFTGFLGATAGQVLTALDHQDFPYERLVELVEPEHSPGRNPVFDTMLAVQPAGLHDLELLGAPVRFAEEAIGQSMFDLNLHLFDQTDRLRGIWAYRSDLFDSATVAALRDTLIEILDAVLTRPQVRIGELTGPTPSGPASTPAPEIALKF